ncbi:hypothetical protein CDAR_436671 [Caerostris darwini]|uniref:Transmembrane protein n=1 Tax=Caerostris darwini TaxID=1538125 RepID=A0AAV4SE87_9ARAC|nr:hypothetical protein CDAR_436671 [Caerostris darwini]
MCRTQVVPGVHRTRDPSPPRGAVWTLTDMERRWMRPLWKTPNCTTEPPYFFSSFSSPCIYSSAGRRNLTSKIIFRSASQSKRSAFLGGGASPLTFMFPPLFEVWVVWFQVSPHPYFFVAVFLLFTSYRFKRISFLSFWFLPIAPRFLNGRRDCSGVD